MLVICEFVYCVIPEQDHFFNPRVVILRVKLISLEIKLVLNYQFYFAKINTNFFSI